MHPLERLIKESQKQGPLCGFFTAFIKEGHDVIELFDLREQPKPKIAKYRLGKRTRRSIDKIIAQSRNKTPA